MVNTDLHDLRCLAINSQISYSSHAVDQMLSRNIGRATVQAVLSSPTNQLIETQAPSTTPGKEHDDERALISDPTFEDRSSHPVSPDSRNTGHYGRTGNGS